MSQRNDSSLEISALKLKTLLVFFLPHSWDESLLDQYSVLADNFWIRLDQCTTLKAVFPLTKKTNKEKKTC